MPPAISSMKTNSSFLWEREDSPGPIFIASQSILIQSDVVGDENVSVPVLAAAFTSGESSLEALDLFDRFRALRLL